MKPEYVVRVRYDTNTQICAITITTKPYPSKWGRLHGSNYAVILYHISYFYPTH